MRGVRLEPVLVLALVLPAWGSAQEPPPDQLPLAAPAAGAAGGEKATIDKTEFERLFDDAMKRREDKKKQDEDDARKKKEADGHEVGSDLTLKASWKHGVYFETPNKDFSYHIGGGMQYDFTWFTAEQPVQFGPGGVGAFNDGFNFRRGRVRNDVVLWEVVEFSFELEFFNAVRAAGATTGPAPVPDPIFNGVSPTEAHMTLTQLPVVGNVRIGWQKEPFSLEHINSYRYLEFLERSPLFDAAPMTGFSNARSPGITFFNTALDERLWWAVGGYRNVANQVGFGLGDGDYAVTGRLAGTPLYENDGERLVHVGGGASYRNPIDDRVRLRSRVAIRNAPQPLLPVIVDTRDVFATSNEVYNLEFAAVFGPLTIQSEFLADFVRDASTPETGPVGDAFFPGYYVEALYFLTGEVRPYEFKLARFGRVVPLEPFYLTRGQCGPARGTGAWEVGCRYSYLDLTSRGIYGGVLHEVTLGVNWYLNPNAKLQVNYDIARRGDTNTPADGTVQGLGIRMHYDF